MSDIPEGYGICAVCGSIMPMDELGEVDSHPEIDELGPHLVCFECN